MNKLQKPRRIWLSDTEYKQLIAKARELYTGKGLLSKYIRKIARSNSVLIIEGTGKVKLTMENE